MFVCEVPKVQKRKEVVADTPCRGSNIEEERKKKKMQILLLLLFYLVK